MASLTNLRGGLAIVIQTWGKVSNLAIGNSAHVPGKLDSSLTVWLDKFKKPIMTNCVSCMC